MRRALIVVLAILAPTAMAEIYKHADKHGNVVYTDQPPENAEPVTLPKPNVLNMDPAARDASTRYKNDAEMARRIGATPAAAGYTQLRIAGVPDGETLQNPEEDLTVSAKSDPPVRVGHKLVILHNGEIANADGSESIAFPHPDRGTHVFVAEIRDEQGAVLISSSTVTVTVQRTSVINRPQTR